MSGIKLSNAYADEPALTGGGDRLDDAAAELVREWDTLHRNGIVPQAPPRRVAGGSQ